MNSDPANDYLVESLTKRHRRESFSCGVEALDRYFRQQIGQDTRRRVARAFVLIHPQSDLIAGFYTLANGAIHLEELPPELANKLPRYPQIPATPIGRLAVDLKCRGLRLGEFLLLDALRRSLIGCEISASFAVVVDAKDHAARGFYKKFGFVQLEGSERRLFLPMETIERLQI